MTELIERVSAPTPAKHDADYVFYELTRSICPECRCVIDAQILLRDNKVYMRKRCPEHGRFEALIYGDAEAYTANSKFNKPGTIPLQFTTKIERGCPHDCRLCPDHQQHACLGIIEVNSGCNMDCPLCFANAGAGFTLTLEEVEAMLDHLVETEGKFLVGDFVPVPCCFPTCNSVTYAYVDGDTVLPLTRILEVDDYLDYITNRAVADLGAELKQALEGLWSSSVALGSDKATGQFALACSACGLADGVDLGALADRIFMVMFQDFMDPWTFNQKNVMKCCKEILLPDGKQIPFCAYNNVGYREQARIQLEQRTRDRAKARHQGAPYHPPPLTFSFEPSPAPAVHAQ